METPRYEYSESVLLERIASLTQLKAPYGLLVRYAVKANMFEPIIQILHSHGIHFDASSSYEAAFLLEQGVPGAHISLSSQQSPHNLLELLDAGVQFVATSFKQLELFLLAPERPDVVAVRINPAVGYGYNNRTNTGGVNASFGIWHEYIPEIVRVTSERGVAVNRVHIHCGSGADPAVWAGVMDTALSIMEQFPDATTLDIGGGFKVARTADEVEVDMTEIMNVFSEKLHAFQLRTGRALKLEIEPGAYVVAASGTLVATVDDIVDTGEQGHVFLRLNTGMNDFMRTSLYGAQHRITVVTTALETKDYIVVGHNCESGDLLTPAPGNPEVMLPRQLPVAQIGDEVRIHDVGAYGASMRVRGYNAFPDAAEYLVS